jgi:hypothetical protein
MISRERKKRMKNAVLMLVLFVATMLAVSASSALVYYTPKGSCYHHRTCRTLKKSKSVYSISVSEAKEKGLKPCQICRP